ncbi:MAG: hypothetical protein AAFX52_01845 [Pseudomonadota bacterium]
MRLTSILLMACGLAGCASNDAQKRSTDASSNALFGRVQTVQTEAPDPSPLANSSIPSGQCGMILWSQMGARTVPIFRSVGITKASMTVEQEPIDFILADQSGVIRLGMAEQQDFVSGPSNNGPVGAKLRFEWGQAFPGGSYVQRGTLTVSGADGWERVMPVAGIAGCKA